MNDDGYIYTTITAQAGGPTRIGVHFYLDKHARIEAFTEGTDRPFLLVSHGDVSAVISPLAAEPTAQDAEIARHFADRAAQYAAEVERRCTAVQAPGPAAA